MIYVNGEFYKKEDAKISVYDRGLLYGDGVFEGIRIYKGKAFKLKEHIDRIFESAKAIYIDIGLTKEELIRDIENCIAKNKKEEAYIRVVVTRGAGTLGIDLVNIKRSTVIIIVDDINLYPGKLYSEGIKIMTSSYRRIPVESFDVRIKSLNYLNNILAKMEAKRMGCMECLMLNVDGYVVECTVDNIFMVKDSKVKTPDICYGALNGITRNVVIDILKDMNLKIEESLLSRIDVYNADEVFLTGTAAEIIPVNNVDGIVIGNGKPGEITNKIMKEYKEVVSNS